MTVQPLPAALLGHAEARPGAVALRHKHLGLWQETTWSELRDWVERTTDALERLGVRRGGRVAIQMENRPEWVVTDLAAQALGAVVIALDPGSDADEVRTVLRDSGAVVLIAADEEQLDKALLISAELQALQHIVVVDPRGIRVLDDPAISTFAELAMDGHAVDGHGRVALADRVAALDGEASQAREGAAIGRPGDEVLSYLPLSQGSERSVSVIDAVNVGYTVNFGEGRGSFGADMFEVQPTVFLGTALVWDEMKTSVEARMADAPRVKRFIYRFWTKQGAALGRRRANATFGPLQQVWYAVGWFLLYRSLKSALGLSRVRVALAGDEPVPPETRGFMAAIGVQLLESVGVEMERASA